MSEAFFDRLERLTGSLEKLEGFMEKIPRIVSLGGAMFFGGRASERLGGDFNTGALGGAVALDLAHSQLPNNQIAGLALGVYFTSIGIANMVPLADERTFDEKSEDFDRTLGPTEVRMTNSECAGAGGTATKVILAVREDGSMMTSPIPSGFDVNLIPPGIQVVCKLPAQLPPHENGMFDERPIIGGIQR